MSRIKGCLLLIPMVFLLACGGSGSNPKIGTRAPDFRAEDLAGRRVYLNSRRGKPVILFFYATWCVSCHEEMERMVKLKQTFQDRLAILAAVIDTENIDKIRRTAAAFSVNYPILLDEDGRIARRYGVAGLPATFLIDAEGLIRRKLIGWDEETAEILIETFEGMVD